jgi:adenine-specific DNA-methyltransferase
MGRPRLELTWPNKDKFLLTPRDLDGRPIWVEPTHPAASEVRLAAFGETIGETGSDPHSDNLLFTGDALDVLRILIEVPEFRQHYRGRIKLIYIDPPFNTGQTFTHYDDWMEHSTWLSFMRDRLLLIRELLALDGSVWVHLDDVEQHRMRCLMDEVFGSEAFVTEITWQKKYKPGNSLSLHSMTNPILVYGRSKAWRRSRGLPPGDDQVAKYKNPDSDPRGPWRLTHAGERTYLEDLVSRGAMPTNWWPYTEVGHGEMATREARALFGADSAFSTPKPEILLQRIIHLASSPGDVVLDCFAGSGTTAAVAHKMGRRWVTCEVLPETVGSFTRPRLTKVIAGEDPGGITATVGWQGGGGFRTVEVASSMYEVGPGGLVLLADWATNDRFARAVAGQLGFTFEATEAPFCGSRGRMRLAVYDAAIGPEEVVDLVSKLGERERVTAVAKVVLPEAEDTLAKLSPGSRIRKAPRDLLGVKRVRTLRGRA